MYVPYHPPDPNDDPNDEQLHHTHQDDDDDEESTCLALSHVSDPTVSPRSGFTSTVLLSHHQDPGFSPTSTTSPLPQMLYLSSSGSSSGSTATPPPLVIAATTTTSANTTPVVTRYHAASAAFYNPPNTSGKEEDDSSTQGVWNDIQNDQEDNEDDDHADETDSLLRSSSSDNSSLSSSSSSGSLESYSRSSSSQDSDKDSSYDSDSYYSRSGSSYTASDDDDDSCSYHTGMSRSTGATSSQWYSKNSHGNDEDDDDEESSILSEQAQRTMALDVAAALERLRWRRTQQPPAPPTDNTTGKDFNPDKTDPPEDKDSLAETHKQEQPPQPQDATSSPTGPRRRWWFQPKHSPSRISTMDYKTLQQQQHHLYHQPDAVARPRSGGCVFWFVPSEDEGVGVGLCGGNLARVDSPGPTTHWWTDPKHDDITPKRTKSRNDDQNSHNSMTAALETIPSLSRSSTSSDATSRAPSILDLPETLAPQQQPNQPNPETTTTTTPSSSSPILRRSNPLSASGSISTAGEDSCSTPTTSPTNTNQQHRPAWMRDLLAPAPMARRQRTAHVVVSPQAAAVLSPTRSSPSPTKQQEQEEQEQEQQQRPCPSPYPMDERTVSGSPRKDEASYSFALSRYQEHEEVSSLDGPRRSPMARFRLDDNDNETNNQNKNQHNPTNLRSRLQQTRRTSTKNSTSTTNQNKDKKDDDSDYPSDEEMDHSDIEAVLTYGHNELLSAVVVHNH